MNKSVKTEILGVPALLCTGSGRHPIFGKEHYCVNAEDFCKIADMIKPEGAPPSEISKIKGAFFFKKIPIIYSARK